MFEKIWSGLTPWLPTAAAIVGTVIVAVAARLIIRRAGSDRHGLPYQRQIATTLIGLAGVFAVVVLLPIDPDLRTQILSLLGVLISAIVAFSSTSLVGNAMAGIMMRLTKSYKPGDFVEVGEIVGRVTNQGLFHTEVQLITRDIVALPNLHLSRTPVHVTRSSGTFVSVEVSLGYETTVAEVDEALRAAVEAAELSEPFVLVDRLLDHAIVYQVFGLLEETSKLLTTRSRLRREIIASLHERGIAIVSPGYVNRVEYPEDHAFLPEEPSRSTTEARPQNESNDEVEAIAFDKAEEAESIERLYALLDNLEKEHDELNQKIRSAGSRDEKNELRKERDEVETRIERTNEIIKGREEE